MPVPSSIPLPLVERQLIVFDFDWSLADQDTDRWVHEVLCPPLRAEMKAAIAEGKEQFTDLCARMLVKLHEKGFGEEQIRDALRKMPFHPAMINGVRELKAAKKPDTTFFLLSNSNEVYIDTILQHHSLRPIFTEVVTNPATFESSGLLRLRRRIDPSAAEQHTCKVGCSANMCKGDELDAFLQRHTPAFDRIIYVGDGGNDYCPVLRLRPQDLALVRGGRGLESRIAKDGAPVCQIRKWLGAWEMYYLLGDLHGGPSQV